MVVQPDFVQIISWNDYGESHYIGPLYNIDKYEAFSVGEAPVNYAHGMPHDGWRLFLPYYIDIYKNGKASITKEGVVGWYRRILLQNATMVVPQPSRPVNCNMSFGLQRLSRIRSSIQHC